MRFVRHRACGCAGPNSKPRRALIGRTGACSLALTVLVFAGAPPSDAARPRKAPAAVTRAVERLQTQIRHTKLTVRAKRRDVRLARRGERLFKQRRYCAGLRVIGRIDRVGRLRRAVGAVESAVARARLARSCQIKTASADVRAQFASGGGFPPGPLQPGSVEAPNEQGEELPPLPEGPFRPGTKQGSSTGADLTAESAGAAANMPPARAGAVTDPVQMFTRTGFGPEPMPISYFADPSSDWGPPDPAQASAGKVVLVGVNTWLGYSTDGGNTFKWIDPGTIFPDQPDGGICCDMQLQYEPHVDRFFLLMQYWCGPPGSYSCPGSGTNENRYRLAIASPAQVSSSGATAWKWFDFTSKTFNQAGQWMDYPDMALGAKSLYFTFNLPRKSSAIWVRIATADLANLNSIGFQYLTWNGGYVLTPVQNTGTRGWIARRKDTSTFDLVYADDGSNYAYAHSVGFPTPPSKSCAQTGADGVNFLSMFDCAGFSQYISGAAQRSNGDIWLAWTAGRRLAGASKDLFPHPNIQLLTIDSTTYAVKRQRAIWNPDYAFAYPELSASAGGEVVMSFVAGGGPIAYPSFGVGFVTNKESFTLVAKGSSGRYRIGDYYTVRPAFPSSKLFSAAGYVLAPAPSEGAQRPVFPWWTLFGRSGDKPLVILPPPVISPAPPPEPEPTPPPPPPPSPTTETMTISCPSSVPVGTTMTVRGQLEPALSGAGVTVTYTPPDAADVVHSVATDSSGSWSDSVATGRQLGTWKVKAHYGGDATHTAADASCDVPVG